MNSPLLPWKTASSTGSVGMVLPDWTLATWVGEDCPERAYRVPIRFEVAFEVTPVVQVALAGFDHDQRTSGRIRLTVADLTPDGFTLVITTWRDTRVYGVDYSWLALRY